MNTTFTQESLKDVLLQTRAKSLFDKPGTNPIPIEWCQSLDGFVSTYESKFGERPDPLKLFQENPHAGAAFFDLDTLMMSVEMKIVVWRILNGFEIVAIELSLRQGSVTHFESNYSLEMKVRIRGPQFDQGPEDYSFGDSNDLRFLRHLGTVTRDGNVRFSGYYSSSW